jgi:hypothetical protein
LLFFSQFEYLTKEESVVHQNNSKEINQEVSHNSAEPLVVDQEDDAIKILAELEDIINTVEYPSQLSLEVV